MTGKFAKMPKKSFDIGVLSPEDYYSTKEVCAQNNYDDRFCGFSIDKML